jgi:peptidoglycan/LPS O-acetylase OafA/YrhL
VIVFGIVLIAISGLEVLLLLFTAERDVAGGRAKAHRVWDGQIGPVAAQWVYRSARARQAFAASMLASLVCFVVAVVGPGGGATRPAFGFAFIALMCLGLVWVLVSKAWSGNSCREASLWLGVKVSQYNFPPADPAKFEAWCIKRKARPRNLDR